MLGINLRIIGAAGLAVLLAIGGGFVWGRLDGAALTEAAVERALKAASEETDNAISELADEADQARLRYHLCLRDPRGMRWSFENDKCVKAETQP